MENKRKLYFDSYRGIGACIIVLYHFTNTFGLQSCADSHFFYVLNNIHNIGYLPVEFFYFSSGFFIYQFYYPKISSQNLDLFPFFKKRISKIYPLFFLSTLVQIILELFQGKRVALFDAITNFFLFQCGFIKTNDSWRNDINGVTWFICPLLVSYFIFYYITKKVSTKENYYVITILLVICSIVLYNWGLSIPLLNPYMLRGIMGFFMGVLFNIIYSYSKTLKKATYTFICISLLLILHFEIKDYLYGATKLITLMNVIAIPSIIIITENIYILRKILENPFFKMLGDISMELYFFHWPIMTILSLFIRENQISAKGYIFLLTIVIIVSYIIHFIIVYLDNNHLSPTHNNSSAPS